MADIIDIFPYLLAKVDKKIASKKVEQKVVRFSVEEMNMLLCFYLKHKHVWSEYWVETRKVSGLVVMYLGKDKISPPEYTISKLMKPAKGFYKFILLNEDNVVMRSDKLQNIIEYLRPKDTKPCLRIV